MGPLADQVEQRVATAGHEVMGLVARESIGVGDQEFAFGFSHRHGVEAGGG